MKIYVIISAILLLGNSAFAMKREREQIEEKSGVTFPDGIIELVFKEKSSTRIPVSKVQLAKHSKYFDREFRRNYPHGNEIRVPMPTGYEDLFKQIIIFLHSIGSSKPNAIEIINKFREGKDEELRNFFHIIIAFEIANDALIDFLSDIAKQKGSGEVLEKLIPLVDKPSFTDGELLSEEELANNKAFEKFITKMLGMVKTHFKNTNDCLEEKRLFKKLPYKLVEKGIFCNPQFQTDSEQSLYGTLCLWIGEYDDSSNLKPIGDLNLNRMLDFKKLSELIDLNRISDAYLLSIFAPDIDAIVDPGIKQELTELYVKSLESRLGKEQQQSDLHAKHATVGFSPDKFAMKVEFRRIDEWKEGEKYYSQPVYSNGFAFYFFMRVESKDNTPPYLAGYLRCTGHDTRLNCKDNTHYLPADVTFEIALKNGKTRKFPPVSVVFDHFDRSIGSRMNQPNDSLRAIREGSSEIVKDNKIVVIIGVEFKKLKRN